MRMRTFQRTLRSMLAREDEERAAADADPKAPADHGIYLAGYYAGLSTALGLAQAPERRT